MSRKLKPQGDLVFALDIGTRTVVGMLGEYINEKLHITDYVSIPHPKRAMIDGQVEDIKQVAKIVGEVKDELEKRTGVNLEKVAIAAAGRALRTSRVCMEFDTSDKEILSADDVKSMEIETMQKAQAEIDAKSGGKTVFYCVGHSIISYAVNGYKMMSLVGHKGDLTEVDLVAAFLPSVVVEGLYSVMDICGLDVVSLTLEPIAAMNVIVPPEIRLINIALVDIGAGTSDIAIAKDGTVCAYAMATTAGDEITEVIIKKCLVDFDTAEFLKQNSEVSGKLIEYRDILGISHKIKAEEICRMVTPAVETLADTISEAIINANGSSPAAVFLVGGGSLIEGLPVLLANKLGLDDSRVAIGGGEFIKNVNSGGKKLGAELVTPVGIGVTSVLDEGYDFSVIDVNDKKVRVFDTRQLTVYEALTIAGCKATEIMGRSGRNLTFTVNGERRLVKGDGMKPAEIRVNGITASVMTKVTQGDKISIKPAVCGENGKSRLFEAINYGNFDDGEVTIFGEKHKLGLTVTVNGEEKDPDYEIEALDAIEVNGVVTFGDLLRKLDIELVGVEYRIKGKKIEEDYVLSDGEAIAAYDGRGREIGGNSDEPEETAETAVTSEEPDHAPETYEEYEQIYGEDDYEEEYYSAPVRERKPEPVAAGYDYGTKSYESLLDSLNTQITVETLKNEYASAQAEKHEPKVYEPVPTAGAEPPAGSSATEGINVILNGYDMFLPRVGGGNILIDLLNYVEIDPTIPNTELVLKINGQAASFTTPIKEGDRIVICLQERT